MMDYAKEIAALKRQIEDLFRQLGKIPTRFAAGGGSDFFWQDYTGP
jgi:hypothetical protein